MSKTNGKGKWDISYFVVNINKQRIRQTIFEGKAKFDEQCEIKDFVKYICKIFEENGFFDEKKEAPLEIDKIFWGIDKLRIINALVVRFAPVSIIDPKRVRIAAAHGFLIY